MSPAATPDAPMAKLPRDGAPNATHAVRLRPLADADEALFHALYGDAATMRHIAAPLDAAAVTALFVRARGLPGIGYRVVESRCGVALGLGAVFGTGGERELGLMLLPAHAGQGHGRPALLQLIALAVAEGVQGLHAKHARGHRAVAWLLAACGFRHAGDDGAQRCWHRALG